jgi:hypothetical protein
LGWNGGRVSIVGTLALSVLISSGLFSLQMISKWRRPKPAETEAKTAGLNQPLTIASAQNDAQPADDPADPAALATSPSQPAALPADAGDTAHHGLDGIFAANNKVTSDSRSASGTNAGRAPYAPDPIDLSNASGAAVDNRTVMAPEADTERGSLLGGQPTLRPTGHAASDQNTTANLDLVPEPPHDPADRAAVQSPSKPPAASQPNAVQGLFEHAGASRQPIGRLSQDTAESSPPSQPAGSKNVNLVEWNRLAPEAAPVAPAAATQVPEVADAARNSLDAPGPVILPGRNEAASGSPAAGISPAVTHAAGTTSGTNDVIQANASPQLRDLAERPAADPTQIPPAAVPTTSGNDPVSGLFDHRPAAAAPDAAHSVAANALAALDHSKVMSFQFRNAPWTVVLAQFAAETHLELRMQSVPQGVFNRWDSARYSPSQTLAILNSELGRTGCQLKLEGNVLRVSSLSPTTTAAPTHPAAAPSASAWLPQSSGIVPVSGRY